MEKPLTGDLLAAANAMAAGSVNRVAPRECLVEETRTLAEHIAFASPFVIDLGTQALYAQRDMPRPIAYAYTTEVNEVMSLHATTPGDARGRLPLPGAAARQVA